MLPKFKLKNTFFATSFNPNDYKADIDYDLLKDSFCKREEELKAEEEEKKKMQSKATKVKFLLDAKKIGDIGIQLSSYPLSIKDTVDALLRLDDTVLD